MIKKWFTANFLRLWISVLAGMGTGLLIEMFVGIWRDPSINSWLMLMIIIGSAIAYWFILANNKNFGKF